MNFFIRLFIPIAICGFCLYSYIDKQNSLTELRIAIPTISKEIKAIHEENTRLKYEIDLFESPEHLLMLAKSSTFTHLKHPLAKDILTVNEGIALLPLPELEEEKKPHIAPKLTLAAK